MTQLYSNLVNYVNSTTYLCLVLAVLCSLVVLRVRLVSLHTWQHQWDNLIASSHVSCPMCSLASVPPFILIIENKGGPTLGFKTENLLCMMEVWTFWYRKRWEWVEEIYRVLLDVPLCITKDKCSRVQTEMLISWLYTKFGLHNIPIVFKIFPLSACI